MTNLLNPKNGPNKKKPRTETNLAWCHSQAIFQFFSLLAIFFSTNVHAENKPNWFQADSKTSTAWDFFCQGTGKTEEESLNSARAQCSQKVCMLFGVEVSSETKSVETLKDAQVTNTIIEKCPNVRVVGKIEKRKSIDCGEENQCLAFVEQVYPKNEYLKEYERLNRPAIVKEFEKTIIIREGTKTYKDPKACRQDLQKYSEIRGELDASQKLRLSALAAATTDCDDIDDRNVSLQSELRPYLYNSMSSRPGTYASRMAIELSSGGNLVDLIKKLKAIETEKLEGEKLAPIVKKLVTENFEWLFYRDNYLETGDYKLLSGKIVKENPYTTEQKNCQKHFDVLWRWPNSFLTEINVCVPNVKSGESCQMVSELTLRFGYFACLCHLGSKAESDCIRNLNQFVMDNCGNKTDPSCLKKIGKYAAESLALSKIPTIPAN